MPGTVQKTIAKLRVQFQTAVDTGGIVALERDINNLRSGVDKLAKGAAVMAASITAGMYAATKTILPFETAMNELKAVFIDAATASELRDLRIQARKLGASTARTATDAANAQVELARAGLNVNETLSATPAVLNLAIAGNLDMATSAQLVISQLNSFDRAASTSINLTDIMAKTATSAATTVSQLAPAYRQFTPLAKATKISFEEASAAVGTMRNAGLVAEQAGTAFRNVILRLVRPTAATAKALRRVGLDSEKVAEQVREGQIIDVFQQLHDAELDAANASLIFGLRAVAAGLKLTQNVHKWRAFAEELRNSENAAERMREAMETGLPGAMWELKASYESMLLALGDAGLTSVVITLTKVLTEFLRLFERLPGPLKTFIAVGMAPLVVLLTAFGAAMKIASFWLAYELAIRRNGLLTMIKENGLRNTLNNMLKNTAASATASATAIKAETAAIIARNAAITQAIVGSGAGNLGLLTGQQAMNRRAADSLARYNANRTRDAAMLAGVNIVPFMTKGKVDKKTGEIIGRRPLTPQQLRTRYVMRGLVPSGVSLAAAQSQYAMGQMAAGALGARAAERGRMAMRERAGRPFRAFYANPLEMRKRAQAGQMFARANRAINTSMILSSLVSAKAYLNQRKSMEYWVTAMRARKAAMVAYIVQLKATLIAILAETKAIILNALAKMKAWLATIFLTRAKTREIAVTRLSIILTKLSTAARLAWIVVVRAAKIAITAFRVAMVAAIAIFRVFILETIFGTKATTANTVATQSNTVARVFSIKAILASTIAIAKNTIVTIVGTAARIAATVANFVFAGSVLVAKIAVFALTAAMGALNAVMMLNPFVAIGVALIAAGFLIYKFRKQILGFFQNLGSSIVNAFQYVIDWLSTAWQKIVDIVTWPIRKAMDAVNWLGNAIKKLVNPFGGLLGKTNNYRAGRGGNVPRAAPASSVSNNRSSTINTTVENINIQTQASDPDRIAGEIGSALSRETYNLALRSDQGVRA